MDSGLKDKVVLITGASGGIGAACARMFADEGARLVLHANTQVDRAKQLAVTFDVQALALHADLRDEAEVAAMFRTIVDHFGRLDVLVANAGVWPPADVPIHDMTLERWTDTIAVNQTGVFLCAREFFRLLRAQKPDTASMVIVGSTAAVFGEENHADYAASKAAVVYGLTRTLKNEIVRIVPRGRVNAVCPGWTLTRMTEDELRQSANVASVLQTRAHKRIGRAEDVASAVVYVASDRLAGHITGEIITVAGGMEGRLLHREQDVDPQEA